jgi:streptogramin lyase/4-amino-4-deoxy-L-arabinose transferase-like glycosyltransferase
MTRTVTIRRFLGGSVALLLAFVAQGRLTLAGAPGTLPALAGTAIGQAALLYLAALLLFLLLFRNAAPLRNPPTAELTKHFGPGWPWRLLPAIAALGLGILALRALVDVERPSPLFWRYHLASVAACLGAAVALDWRGLPSWGMKLPTPSGAHPRWRTGLILLTILAVAVWLRLWRFDELPFGTWYDEAENGLQALRILQTPEFWPLFVGSIHAPAHYLYLITWAFEAFGVSTQSIRLVSVVMGVATVLAGYWVGRELFGRMGGLLLAFLLAVARWNINFSRIGMYNASTPLFELLVIGLLLRGLRRGRYLDYALAGLALGWGLCFYAAFQLFVPVVGLFLLALMISERGFLRRAWSGLALLTAMTLLVIAPVLRFAYEKPDLYFARTKNTALFAKTAPEERLAGLLENTRKHLLMFNYRGDPNGRHNLPGEPMLDPYSGALFVLGLGVSLWAGLRGQTWARLLLLPLWLAITLLGGILSLDFEAPQSLRAIGTQPVVYILAVIPLWLLWRAWRDEGGRYAPRAVLAPLLLLLGVIGVSNFHTYFFRQAADFAVWNAFSTPETITATLLGQMDVATVPYVISFFHGHPTINFLARGSRPYGRLETTDHLPLSWPADQPVALITNADSRHLYDEARRIYPQAEAEEFRPPFGGPTVVYYTRLTSADLASVQGVQARYFGTDDWSGPPLLTRQEPILAADWAAAPPLALPFSAEWAGVLQVQSYGPHQFFLQAPADAELYIGEERILAGSGEQSNGVLLAQGHHTLRVRAVGAAGPISLAWRPPDRGPELIPAWALYGPPVTGNGLLGEYYPNADWQPPAALAKIDPQLNLYFHIPSLPRPYTVEWRGKIAIPQSGSYRFGLESIDEAALWINEQPVVSSTEPNIYAEDSSDLTQGLHDIRIRYSDRTDHTHINLYWTPPGAGQQPVPSAALFPPQGNYERVTLPSLAALTFPPTLPGETPRAPQPVSPVLPAAIQPVITGLVQPRGVAATAEGTLYVADTGNRRVLRFAETGEVQGELTPGAVPFEEPFDLAVDRQGQLYVLDAVGRISLFDAQGVYVRDVPAPARTVERARGLFVDAQDRIWVASTPNSRVVALDQAGAIVLEIAVWPGEDSQPTDVAVGADGTIFVVDEQLHKLVRFSADGRRLLAWAIPVSNTLDGAHLAVDGAGFLYLTQPETGRVAKLLPEGDEIGHWALPRAGAPVKPVGVGVDGFGRIWVADVVGGAVLAIEPGE